MAPSSRRKKQVATPPAHLATKTKAWFKAVCEDYDLEDHHVRLLTLASEAWDRCEQARDGIQMHGLTYEDRFGAPHARPEIAIERDSRIAFARLIREMDLDVEGPAGAEPARLPPLRSNRRGT